MPRPLATANAAAPSPLEALNVPDETPTGQQTRAATPRSSSFLTSALDCRRG